MTLEVKDLKIEKDAIISDTLDLFWHSVPPLWHITRALTHTIAAEEFNITPSKFHTLRRIVEGRQYVSQLAECLHLSRPNISRMVSELVQDGYIERHSDPHDRRNVRLLVTEKGQRLFDILHNRIHAQMAELFSCLTKDELIEVNRGLFNMQKLISIKENN